MWQTNLNVHTSEILPSQSQWEICLCVDENDKLSQTILEKIYSLWGGKMSPVAMIPEL